jgi:hypothetical protein
MPIGKANAMAEVAEGIGFSIVPFGPELARLVDCAGEPFDGEQVVVVLCSGCRKPKVMLRFQPGPNIVHGKDWGCSFGCCGIEYDVNGSWLNGFPVMFVVREQQEQPGAAEEAGAQGAAGAEACKEQQEQQKLQELQEQQKQASKRDSMGKGIDGMGKSSDSDSDGDGTQTAWAWAAAAKRKGSNSDSKGSDSDNIGQKEASKRAREETATESANKF